MDVLPQFCVVVQLVVVVATVTDLLQPSVPWLHLNLSITMLFVPTGGPPHKCSLVALRVCLVQLWIPENLISGISCGKAAVWNQLSKS
jgi:hypothetical protein